MSKSAPMAQLRAAGFQPQGFVMALKTAHANVVVQQLPGAGTMVERGTTVLVVFNMP
jgi:beta-lactam-binding protein with PASTA domain